MYKILFLIFFLFILTNSDFNAEASGDLVLTGVLNSRKVAGVINFTQNNAALSKKQMAEIDRITAVTVAKIAPDKIIRVEGFSVNQNNNPESFDTAFSRARLVWEYLERKDSLNINNLYLTGFTVKQQGSNFIKERVEIAIYDNPFNENIAYLQQ